MLIRAEDRPEIAEAHNAIVMRPLVTAAEHGADLSITSIRLDGRHRRLRSDRSTRAYYVVDGQATFRVGDEPPCVAGRGDVVVIPPGTPYEFEGQMTYLVINGPAFRDGDDTYCDD
jgi:mannose-6-phosphate isomerase-like protein (cupin superfamily)